MGPGLTETGVGEGRILDDRLIQFREGYNAMISGGRVLRMVGAW